MVGVAAVLIRMAEQGRRWAMLALGCFGGRRFGRLRFELFGRWTASADLHAYVAGISRPPGAVDVRMRGRRHAQGFRTGDRMLLAGLERVDGYAGLEPAKRARLSQARRKCGLAGAEWLLARTTPRDDAAAVDPDRADRTARSTGHARRRDRSWTRRFDDARAEPGLV